MERTPVKVIEFEGEKISNLEELFHTAQTLSGGGWFDYHSENVSCSQRTIAAWLEPEDSVIYEPSKTKRTPCGMAMKPGLWYRYHGLVQVIEAFETRCGDYKHMIGIYPLRSAFDVAHGTEEPDGRKQCYKEAVQDSRNAKFQTTVSKPSAEEVALWMGSFKKKHEATDFCI